MRNDLFSDEFVRPCKPGIGDGRFASGLQVGGVRLPQLDTLQHGERLTGLDPRALGNPDRYHAARQTRRNLRDAVHVGNQITRQRD